MKPVVVLLLGVDVVLVDCRIDERHNAAKIGAWAEILRCWRCESKWILGCPAPNLGAGLRSACSAPEPTRGARDQSCAHRHSSTLWYFAAKSARCPCRAASYQRRSCSLCPGSTPRPSDKTLARHLRSASTSTDQSLFGPSN